MAINLNDLDANSLSQSIASDVDESDHIEVHNTFKYRGKILLRWKRMVKANSLIFFIFSLISMANLILFASTHYYHNWGICFVALFASICGLTTGFSFGDPAPGKIYINSVITGVASGII